MKLLTSKKMKLQKVDKIVEENEQIYPRSIY